VTCTNNINVGSANDAVIANRPTVTIEGQGNYTGTVNKYFTIKAVGLDVVVTGYNDEYDGEAHSITVTGNGTKDATITYSTDGVTYSSEKPTYTNKSTNTVYVKVEKPNYNTFTGSAVVEITAKKVVVTWPTDLTFDYTGVAQKPVAGNNNIISGINDEVIYLTVTGEKTNIGGPYEAKATINRVENGEVSNYELTNDTVNFYISNENAKFEASLNEDEFVMMEEFKLQKWL